MKTYRFRDSEYGILPYPKYDEEREQYKTITVDNAANYRLRATGSTFYRIYIDGKFLHFGPARAPHGCLRVDELELKLSQGRHIVA